MTDTPSAPIVVDASPARAQMAAALRQGLLAAGVIAGAFGATHIGAQLTVAATVANELVTVLGAAVAIGAAIAGQIATRHAHQNLTTAAAAAPDSVAQVKP